MEFTYNGYIVQEDTDNAYKGIDGDNWYLNYKEQTRYYLNYYDEHIGLAWIDDSYVDCCIDKNYIRQYILESRKRGIKFRIMLCATNKSYPRLPDSELVNQGIFLGYDYAYSGGDYYSCIINEILAKSTPELGNLALNNNYLLPSYEEVVKFLKIRSEIVKNNKIYLEEGDYAIYKLFEVDANEFMQHSQVNGHTF